MRKLLVATVAVTLGLLAFAPLAGAQALETTGTIESVTLYREQALVTRLLAVDGPAGELEIIVKELPQHVIPSSLFATAENDAIIRAIRYRQGAVAEEPRPELRTLETRIREVAHKVARNHKLTAVLRQRSAFLDQLELFTATSATGEMKHGILNAETIKAVTLFIFEQRQELADEELRLHQEAEELNEQHTLLLRQLAEKTAGLTRTEREALVFLSKPNPGKLELRLSYLVGQAGWSPQYTLRASKGGEQVHLVYNALVRQLSGESWNSVALILSTGTPRLMAEVPDLAPFWVGLAPGRPQQQKQVGQEGAEQYAQQRAQSVLNLSNQSQAGSWEENEMLIWGANRIAGATQQMEITIGDELLKSQLGNLFESSWAAAVEGVSATYQVEGQSSIASRADQQVVQIARLQLDGKVYYLATPVLSAFVYRRAEISNSSETTLLEGQADVYLDGDFVGRARIPLVAPGQTFVAGLGAASSLRSSRELIERTEDLQGGNKVIIMTYRLLVENFGEEKAEVHVKDRVPVAMEGMDIAVSLGEMTHELSEDPMYQRVEHPKGILLWELEAPARTSAENATVIEYSYRLAFDRNLEIQIPTKALEEGQREEFREMQRAGKLR